MSLARVATQAGYGGAAILVSLAVVAGAYGDTTTGLALAVVAIIAALFGVSSERLF